MKKFFQRSVLSLSMLISAEAQSLDFSCMRNLYAEFFGGANFLQTTTNGGITSNYQTGYVVGGSLGYRWCYGLRVEAEYAFRKNSLKSVHFFGRTFPTQGHFQSSSYMGNLIWDIPLADWGCQLGRIQPFIGGGLGYDVQQIHWNNTGLSFYATNKHLSWQAIAGASYPILCNLDLSLEYKFHKGGFNYVDNHSLVVGLMYDFVN